MLRVCAGVLWYALLNVGWGQVGFGVGVIFGCGMHDQEIWSLFNLLVRALAAFKLLSKCLRSVVYMGCLRRTRESKDQDMHIEMKPSSEIRLTCPSYMKA